MPSDEFSDGVVVRPLGTVGQKAYQDSRLVANAFASSPGIIHARRIDLSDPLSTAGKESLGQPISIGLRAHRSALSVH